MEQLLQDFLLEENLEEYPRKPVKEFRKNFWSNLKGIFEESQEKFSQVSLDIYKNISSSSKKIFLGNS